MSHTHTTCTTFAIIGKPFSEILLKSLRADYTW